MRVDKGSEFYNRSMKLWLQKNAIKIYSKFAKKVDLADLKSNVDKLDIDKLVPVSDIVKNDVNKKDKINWS